MAPNLVWGAARRPGHSVRRRALGVACWRVQEPRMSRGRATMLLKGCPLKLRWRLTENVPSVDQRLELGG